MNTITNDAILDTVYDLADSLGVRIDVLIDRIVEEFGEQPYPVDGLPDAVVDELNAARESKREQRRSDRMRRRETESHEEIKRFRELFPDVTAEDIPDSVWASVEGGIPLSYAYALYAASNAAASSAAEAVNSRNSDSSPALSGDGATEPVFTKEQVEKMSGKDVKKNYKSILKAMKSWGA